MTEPILINETCETTNKLSREGKELPIVIIKDKRYAECYNGEYYIGIDENETINKKVSENTTELLKYHVHRIYRINPQTNKFERGGYIQYIENLYKFDKNQACWIGNDAKVCGKTVVCGNINISDNIIIDSQTELKSVILKNATNKLTSTREEKIIPSALW